MTDLPTKSHLTSGSTTEAQFQGAIGDLYDVVSQLALLGPAQSLVISSGSVTPTHTNLVIDTEAAASSDDLDLIVPSNIGSKVVFIRPLAAGKTVKLKHMSSGTGKMYLSTLADTELKDPTYFIALMWDSTASRWNELWRSFGVLIPAGSEASVRASLGLGTAATRDTGISAGQIPLRENLGTAALVNTGVSSGQVPLANQLGSLAFISAVTNAQLDGTGVAPGDYSKVTVNAQGRVTSGALTGFVDSEVLTGGVSPTLGIPAVITSVTVDTGTWQITSSTHNQANGTLTDLVVGYASLTSNGLTSGGDLNPIKGTQSQVAPNTTGYAFDTRLTNGTGRITVTGTTTIYLIGISRFVNPPTYTGSGPKLLGYIAATRVG